METFIVPQYNPATGEGTLGQIAKSKNLTLQQLLDANPQYKANPNLVQAGAQLNIPVATPNNPAGNTPAGGAGGVVDPNVDVAKNAGAAGLGVDDLSKLLASKTNLTEQERNDIRTKLGIPALETSVFSTPSKSAQQIYQDAFNASGLGDIKANITKLTSEIKDLQDKKAQIIGQIGGDPFLNEASRTGRIKRDTETLNSEIAARENQITALNQIYTSGISEVNNVVTRTTNEFEADQNRKAKQLEYLLKQAEAQTELVKSGKAESIAKYLPDYLKGKTDSQKPDTIGTAETGFYRWDAKTGKFVLAVPGTGKKGTDTQSEQQDIIDMSSQLNNVVDSKTGFIPVDKYKLARNAWVSKTGRSAKSFDEAFSHYRNPDEDYNVAL